MSVDSTSQIGKITLYTNHFSPWAHRVHILLKELGLQFDEVSVDLGTEKSEGFLKLNPRGLVPTLVYSHPDIGKPQSVIESNLIVHFLLDAYPHLSQKIYPAAINVEAALLRYRMNLFVDTYLEKVNPLWYKLIPAIGTDQIGDRIDEIVAAVREHIEPMLEDARPFFGGSPVLTFAEIQTAPFIIRSHELPHKGFLDPALLEKFDELPNFSAWLKATTSKESVTYVWNRDESRERFKEKLAEIQKMYGGGT